MLLIIERDGQVRLELEVRPGVELPVVQPGDRVRLLVAPGQEARVVLDDGQLVLIVSAADGSAAETYVFETLALYILDGAAELTIADAGGETQIDTAALLSSLAPAAGEAPRPEAFGSSPSGFANAGDVRGVTAEGDSGLRPGTLSGSQHEGPLAGGGAASASGGGQGGFDAAPGGSGFSSAGFGTADLRASSAVGQDGSGPGAVGGGTGGGTGGGSTGGGGTGGGGTPAPVTIVGQAIDGYIVGATVFRDGDGDGVLDSGEDFATTGANGAFTLTGGSGPLVLTGGIDVSTGQFFKGTMTAPEGSTVVTPLTTLIQSMVEAGQTQAAAEQAVKSAFGLPASIELTGFDPVAGVEAGTAGAAAILAAGIQVQNTVVQVASALQGAGGSAVALTSATDAVFGTIAAALIASPADNPLANGNVQTLIQTASGASTLGLPAAAQAQIATASADLAQIVNDSNDGIEGLASSGTALLSDLAQYAFVAQGSAAQALAQAFEAVQGTGSAANLTTATANFTSAGALGTAVANAASELGAVGTASAAGTDADDAITGTASNDFFDGGAGDDVIAGGGGNDVLIGGAGDDQLTGDGGDDVLIGGAGTNLLNGGNGIDTAQFGGNFAAYSVTATSAGIVTVAGSGSSDRIDTTEILSFADLTVRIAGGNSAYTGFASALSAASAGDRILLIGAATVPDTLALSKRVSVQTVGQDPAVSIASDGALAIDGRLLPSTTTTLDLSGLAGTNALRFTDLGALDTISTASGQTLTLAAGQLDGLNVSGGGTIRVTGGAIPTGADLSGIAASIAVTSGESLTLTAAQADDRTITGAGNVTVTDLGAAAVDLSGITATGAKTAALAASATLNASTDLGSFAVAVAAGQTLTLSAAQANGTGISGAGGVTIADLAATTDLSGIAVGGTVTATVSGTLDLGANGTLGALDRFQVGGSLTLTLDQASGTAIEGAGNVTVTGLTATTDLSGVTVSGSVTATVLGDTDISGNGTLGALDAYQVASGQTLTLSAAQANGATVSGAGGVTVAGLGAAAVDLSGVTAGGVLTAVVAASTTLAATTDLGGFAVTVASGQTLTLSAAQADGTTISGAGGVTVTGLGASALDLSGIAAAGPLTAQVSASVALASGSDLGGFAIAVEAGQTLTLSAAQASGRSVSGAGNVTVSGLGSGAFDLSGVTASGTLTVDVPATVAFAAGTNLGAFSVSIDSGETLTLDAAQASGRSIAGPGNVVVTGLGADQVDFSGITASGTLTARVLSTTTLAAGTNLGTLALSIDSGATLTLGAIQATGRSISGPGDVVLAGDVSTNADLTDIATGLSFDDGDGGALTVAGGATLTLTAAQANGATIAGAGSVLIEGNASASADFSGISAPLAFTSNSIGIASGQTLTLTASQASDKTVTGEGTLSLSGDAGAGADFGGLGATAIAVPASATLTLTAGQLGAIPGGAIGGAGTVALTGDATGLGALSAHVTAGLTVPSGGVLTLTAAQADSLAIGGPGTLNVTGLGTGAVTFENLDVGTVTVTPSGSVTLAAGTDLGGVTLTIPAGVTVTMTAAQASGVTIGGAGTLALTGTLDASVDLSAWGPAAVDLTGLTALDLSTLALPNTSQFQLTHTQANGLAIDGTSGANTVVLDVSGAFSGGDTASIALDIALGDGDDRLVFDFGSQAGNTLNVSGTIDLGGGGNDILESSNGTVNVSSATVTGVESFEINSTITLSASQFAALPSLDGLAGQGEVVLAVDAAFLAAGGPLDLSVFDTFTAGGSTPPTVRILADGFTAGTQTGADVPLSDGTSSFTVTLPGGDPDTTPVIVLLGPDGSDVALGGFAEGRAYFAATTSVFNGSQFATLVEAIETDADGIDSTSGSDVATILFGGPIAVGADIDLTTAALQGVAVEFNGYSVSVASGQTLTLTAAQANGGTIVGAGSVVVTDWANAPDSLDLSGLTAATATLEIDSALDLTSRAADWSLSGLQLAVVDGGALTLTAAQADGLNIATSGTGTVAVAGLGGAAVDLAGLGGTVSAAISGNLALAAQTQLGDLRLVLGEGVELGLTGAQLAGRNVTLAGSSGTLRVGGDLSGLDLSAVDGGISYLIPAGRTLTMTADQADGRGIASADDGSGLYLTQLGAGAVDLSRVSVSGTKSANVPATATLDQDTDLGDFDLTVAGGATLTLTAAQANGTLVSGAGSVTVTDVGSDALDLSEVSATGTLTAQVSASTTLNAATDLGAFAVSVAIGQTLALSAAQADGVTIAGAGTVAIAGLGSAAVDLSGIGASATASVTGPLTLGAATDLGSVALAVAGGTLTLTAAQASGRAIGGAGGVTVTGLQAGTDLSDLTAGGTVTASIVGTVDVSGNATLGAVDAYQVSGSLTLTAAQAQGAAIAGAGNVTVTGLAGTTDLSGIASGGTVVATVTADTDISGNATLGAVDVFQVAAGQTLFLTAAEADGATIVGAGNVTVTGLHSLTRDFSGVTASGTLSAQVAVSGTLSPTTDLGGFGLVVGDGATVTLSAAQANGVAVTGAGSVLLTNLGATAVDLSGIATDFAQARISSSVALAEGTDLGNVQVSVDSGRTLTLSAAQANGAAVTGDGNVTVTGLGADALDLSTVAATGAKTAQLAASATLNGSTDLGTFGIEVAAGQIVTLSAGQASGRTIAGNGGVTVAGLSSDAVDLSSVSASGALTAQVSASTTLNAATDLGDFAVSVAAGQTLTLTAAQADGLTIGGAGNVTITGLGAAAVDLSGIAATGTLTAEVTASATLDPATTLGGFALSVAAGQTLALTAAQAAGTTIGGAGGVTVTDFAGGALDLTAVTAGGPKLVQIDGSLTLGSSVQLGDFGVSLAAGTTLRLTATQADGLAITAGGSVTVIGLGASTTDLSGVAATGTLIALVPQTATLAASTNLGSFGLETAVGSTVTLTAAQADGRSILGAGSVVVTGLSAATDLSNLSVAGTVTALVTTSANLAGNPGLETVDAFQVAAGQTLTLAAAQSGGRQISGAGSVTVTDLGPTSVDLGDVTASGALNVAISTTVALAADTDLGGFALSVASGAVLTLTAAQADGRTITGTGSVVVTGDIAGVDLSGIAGTLIVTLPVTEETLTIAAGETVQLTIVEASTFAAISGEGTLALTGAGELAFGDLLANTIGGDLTLTVPAGGVLSLTAAQASGLQIGGPGTLTLSGPLADGDFSGIGASLDIRGANLTGATQLPEPAAGQTLTLTAAQADGRTIDGEGTVTIGGSFADGFESVTLGQGAWIVDRRAPSGFEVDTSTFDGESVLKHSISADDATADIFFKTQGRQFDIPQGTTVLSVDLYIDPTWEPEGATGFRWASFWGVGTDAAGVVVNRPVIEFTTLDGEARFRAWEIADGWHDFGLPSDFAYGEFFTLQITLQADGTFLYQVGDIAYTSSAYPAVEMDAVILQGHNDVPGDIDAGRTYDIFWDNLEAGPSVYVGETVDLSRIESDLTFADDTVVVAAGATLTLSPEQADGLTVAGAGTVAIVGAVSESVDLTAIAAELDLSGASVASDGMLGLTLAQVDGTGLDIAVGGQVQIQGTFADLSASNPQLPAIDIAGITVDGSMNVAARWEAISLSGGLADKFKLFWQAGDQRYYDDWPNQDVSVNEANVQLGNLYVAYLAEGGAPILDIVQTRVGSTPNYGSRQQSLHDNLLANLGDAAINSRFLRHGEEDPRSELARTYGDRPEHSGAVDADTGLYADQGKATASVMWDIANGLVYPDDAPSAYGTIPEAFALVDGVLQIDGTQLSVTTLDLSHLGLDVRITELGNLTSLTTSEGQQVTLEGRDLDLLSQANGTFTVLGGGAVDVLDAGLEVPNDGTAPSVANLLALEFAGLEKSLVPERLTLGGSHTDAITAFWIQLDQAYVGAGNYYNLPVNTSFAYLGNDYAAYLRAGGEALLDLVKVPAGRLQTLHDNLLGNLGDSAIQGRFLDRGEPDPRTEAGASFGERPYHDGSVDGSGLYDAADAAATLGWDLANGVAVPANLPAPYAVLEGANSLTGNAADNFFFGDAGDDILIGGAGEDTASYRGGRADYVLTAEADGRVRVVDGVPADGDEGSDTLSGIETLAFSDGTMRFGARLARAVAEAGDGNDGFHPGSGNSDVNFAIHDNTAVGVEAALKAKARFVGDLEAEGATYTTETGISSGTAAIWNFDYSIVTYDGRALDDFDIRIAADFVDLQGDRTTDIMLFDAIAHRNATGESSYQDPTNATEGLQNSQNIGWYGTPNGYDPSQPGSYELTLTVVDRATGETVAETSIRVEVRANFVVAADGSGDFTSIQDAIDAAAAGDTILVKDGTYAESLTIGKRITLLGAQAGTDPGGTARTGAETVIAGTIRLLDAADGTTIDGFSLAEGGSVAGSFAGIYLDQGAADVTIRNNVLNHTNNANLDDGSRGILTVFGGENDGLTVSQNSFVGWSSGVYLNPGASAADVSGNRFTANNVGISVDGPDGASISSNSFQNNRFEAIGLGPAGSADASLQAALSDNDFGAGNGNDGQIGVYLDGLTVDVDAASEGVVLNLQSATAISLSLAGAGDATLIGNAQDNVLVGNAGDNRLLGGTGDDELRGGLGADILIGGDGSDVLYGGLGNGEDDGASDIFVFRAGDSGTDTVRDFGIGDTLDLSDLVVSDAGVELLFDDDADGNATLAHASAPSVALVVVEGIASANLTVDPDGNVTLAAAS